MADDAHSRSAWALVWVVALAALLTACGASSRHFGAVQRTASPVLRLAGGAPSHVAVIMMENEEYSDIIGSPATPYLNGLARRYALAAHHFAITHPSLPNYLALTGGSTFGIDSDCTDCRASGPSLGSQLSAARVTWKAYMEDLPRACFGGASAGGYAKKHDPFVYFPAVTGDPAACRNVVPMSTLTGDERAGALPRFVWVTPNLCHDMHDCSPATGDRFLSRLVPRLLSALGPRGLLLITWDEGSSDQGCCRVASGGHIALIAAGPAARAHTVMRTVSDHYSTLQAIEDLFGLARLRGAACPCTPSLGPLLRVAGGSSGAAGTSGASSASGASATSGASALRALRAELPHRVRGGPGPSEHAERDKRRGARAGGHKMRPRATDSDDPRAPTRFGGNCVFPDRPGAWRAGGRGGQRANGAVSAQTGRSARRVAQTQPSAVGGVGVGELVGAELELRPERDPHPSSPVGGVAGLDEAVVGIGGLAHDRQAETRAGF